MKKNVLEAVYKAREFFHVDGFPGDFFSLLKGVDYTEKYRLLLFKEDIDKLSGFIGYNSDDMAAICINYWKSLGHQNFTLAHEIGHWFLHKGQNISDGNAFGTSQETIEKEANEFAGELLYPEELLVKDFYFAIYHDLFLKDNRDELGRYINELCHKYCLSYEVVLRKLLYKNGQVKQYTNVRNEIECALGGKITDVFDRDFYAPNADLPQYQKFLEPYEKLCKKTNILIQKGKIGRATGEAIIMRTERR